MFHIPISFDVFSVEMKSDFMRPVSTLHNALQDKILTVVHSAWKIAIESRLRFRSLMRSVEQGKLCNGNRIETAYNNFIRDSVKINIAQTSGHPRILVHRDFLFLGCPCNNPNTSRSTRLGTAQIKRRPARQTRRR